MEEEIHNLKARDCRANISWTSVPWRRVAFTSDRRGEWRFGSALTCPLCFKAKQLWVAGGGVNNKIFFLHTPLCLYAFLINELTLFSLKINANIIILYCSVDYK